MKKYLFILVCLTTIVFKVRAQQRHSWQLELNATQPIFGEYRLHFFRNITEDWDAGFFLGYHFPVVLSLFSDPLLDEIAASRDAYFLEGIATGYLGGLSSKRRFSKNTASFFQFDLFMRYWQVPDETYTDSYSKRSFMNSENAQSFGIKCLLGREWLLGYPTDKFNVGICGYFGAGVRIIASNSRLTTTDQYNNTITSTSRDGSFRPSIQLGLNFVFRKNGQLLTSRNPKTAMAK